MYSTARVHSYYNTVQVILLIVYTVLNKTVIVHLTVCNLLLVALHARDVQLCGNSALALRDLLDSQEGSARDVICAHLRDESNLLPPLQAAGADAAHSGNVGSLIASCAKRDPQIAQLLRTHDAFGALRDAGKSAVSSSN